MPRLFVYLWGEEIQPDSRKSLKRFFNPAHKSLRMQAKKEGLATIEAVALALECFGENAEKGESLRKQYEEFIIRPNLLYP